MARFPRVLIIGATPYHPQTQSRSYKSYFDCFPRASLRQIFSNANVPVKGICEELYQITDKRLFIARFLKKQLTGKIFSYEQCPQNNSLFRQTNNFIKSHKSAGIYRLLRKALWRQKYWLSDELNKWVTAFGPEVIFVCAGEDFFQFDIAEYFSAKLGIPIVLSVTDDIYFYKNSFSLMPFWCIYKKLFKKRIESFMRLNVIGAFCTEKIRKKYCDYFGIDGFVQYIAAEEGGLGKELTMSTSIKNAYYFGNLEYGRWDSLLDIAVVFSRQKECINLHIYTNDYSFFKKKPRPKNMIIHPPITHQEVQNVMVSADLLIAVESLREKNVKKVAYSLSTKVGELLGSGKPILCYGSVGTGLIDFFVEQKVGLVATGREELEVVIEGLLKNNVDLCALLKRQREVFEKTFNIELQSHLFKNRIENIVSGNRIKALDALNDEVIAKNPMASP